jgi:geranylgeranyl pyrophosphate synthase
MVSDRRSDKGPEGFGMDLEVARFLPQVRAWVDERLEAALARLQWHPEMSASARYVVSGGGKAVRPAVLYWTYASFAGDAGRPPASVLDLGLALEFVHCYSLIHDDLPAMDNDDFRRGRPTLHRVQGEANAILAGDALLTGAFELIATADLPTNLRGPAVRELARAAGGAGMVAGQVMDIQLKGQYPDADRLRENHDLKTGALFGAALGLSSLAASARQASTPDHVARARHWGVRLGLLFQVVDDVLDSTSTGDEGPNYVRLLGLERARSLAQSLRDELAASARELGMGGEGMDRFLDFFVQRTA